MTEDPRLGLPSASSFALTALCPGRQKLLDTLPETPEPEDEDRERGTRLHAAWEKSDPTGLDTEDMAIYERGQKLFLDAINAWQHDREISTSVPGLPETRFYYHDEKGEVAASGQADQHWIGKTEGLVVDFKSLWCRSLVPAVLNWQARLLVVMMRREYGCERVRFAFLKAMFGNADIVDYTKEDIDRAEWSVQQILWESRQPNAQRRAGAHCRWCKANTVCPEAAAWIMLPSTSYSFPTEGITPTVAKELVEQISLENCVKVFRGITARRNIEDAIKARLKALPSGELFDYGLKLGKPGSIRVIDPFKAFQFLLGVNIPAETLWKTLKMSNGELTTVVQQALGLDSKKSAEVWINNKLASCITQVPKEGSLEEV